MNPKPINIENYRADFSKGKRKPREIKSFEELSLLVKNEAPEIKGDLEITV